MLTLFNELFTLRIRSTFNCATQKYATVYCHSHFSLTGLQQRQSYVELTSLQVRVATTKLPQLTQLGGLEVFACA